MYVTQREVHNNDSQNYCCHCHHCFLLSLSSTSVVIVQSTGSASGRLGMDQHPLQTPRGIPTNGRIPRILSRFL